MLYVQLGNIFTHLCSDVSPSKSSLSSPAKKICKTDFVAPTHRKKGTVCVNVARIKNVLLVLVQYNETFVVVLFFQRTQGHHSKQFVES